MSEGWELGVVLKELRHRRGLSLTQMARESGLHKSAVIRIEKGDRHPGLETLSGIAGALNIRFVVEAEGVFIEEIT